MNVELNYVAILVAGLAYWLVGGLWYSALFQKAWMAEMGYKKEDPQMQGKNPMKSMGIQLVLNLVTAYVFAHMLATYQATNVSAGLQGAFWVWLGFMLTLGIASVLFERKTWKVLAINQSYHLVGLAVMSIILVLWK